MTGPSFRRQDERGLFVEVVNDGPWATVISGSMHAGGVIGNHYHKITRMYFYLISGEALVRAIDVETRVADSKTLRPETGINLDRNIAHAIAFQKESNFLLLKSHRYDERSPDTYDYSVIVEAPLDGSTTPHPVG